MVVLGFLTAFYLINSSYSMWLQSPVSTSIETKSIADLDFPTITICPPKGSHTALNYDLMKANDTSLTKEDTDKLENEIYRSVIKQSHQEYIRTMVVAANKENIKQIYKGFQSFPKPLADNSGFDVKMWNNNGTWQTPWFEGEYKTGYHEENRHYYVSLQLPMNLKEQIHSGSLVIQLEVNTREEEGWQEEVSYWEGYKYRLYTEKKNWADAEATCQRDGGHLASVLSAKEQEEARAAMGREDHMWIGATDSKEEGVWRWADGSPWGYHNWDELSGGRRENKNCVFINRLDGYEWWDYHCTETRPFLCQSPLAGVLKGSKTINLEYRKQNLTFPSFDVQYRYTANQQLVNSWQHKRMTGFQVTWRIDNPRMEITTSGLGKTLQTPEFRETDIDESYYKTSRAYKATLLIPNSLQVGSGSLVIMLDVDTREEEGWLEDVRYLTTAKWGPEKYKLYTERKTWSDAEATCQEEGGQLASVLSAEEQDEVRAAMGGRKYIWIGATDTTEEGVWRWTDGSLWGYDNWDSGLGNRGDSKNCAFIVNSDIFVWVDYSCTVAQAFLCQSPRARVLTGKAAVTFKYMAQNLTFPSINVLYRYTANQQLLDSWQEKRMTGFRLSWFLKDINGSRLTGTQNLTEDWKPEAQSPGYQEQQLVSMVQLATQARTENVVLEEVIHRTIKEKAKLIQNGQLDYASMCSGGQIRPDHYNVVAGLNIGLNDTFGGVASDEDVVTGFMMFSTMIYCSESVALSQFLTSLISNQSPRTIIQATFNTIQSGEIKQVVNRKGMNQFYLSLDMIFHFQLGKILLATVSPSELQTMLAKDWPYFSNYSQEIERCLNSTSCQGVSDLVKSLGKYHFNYCKHGHWP